MHWAIKYLFRCALVSIVYIKAKIAVCICATIWEACMDFELSRSTLFCVRNSHILHENNIEIIRES